jgi:hypothetical protein
VSTRAINTHAAHSVSEKGNDPQTEGDSEKKGSASPYVQSINEETPEENDLDPVALEKAFKFAARSSVVLVCFLSPLCRKLLDSFPAI